MTANQGERDAASTAPDAPRRGRVPADTLSNRLLLARRLAGMSIEEAAAAAGLKPSSWSNWENGMRPQGEVEVVQAIADALDIDEGWLLFGGPLEGPRGRRVTRRPSADTLQYSPLPVRPTSVRPRPGRPVNRGDTHAPVLHRPSVIHGPEAHVNDLVAATTSR
jgi:transcriptional regulator with XRE-family HTH domain